MKIQVIELSHSDLVDIFATATYGSEAIDIDYNREEWGALPVKEGECSEDAMADMILNGHQLTVTDFYAEGETYREGAKLDKYGNGIYEIQYSDILNACSTTEGIELAIDLFEGNGDYFTAYNLMQLIVFGEIIYG